MIKVSIIIPIYNVERYLVQCLQSVVNQTLKDIEIICINDGSTDQSGEILEQFARKDSRIIAINQKNQGVSITRNNGLKMAQGKYIGWVDSDDWIDPDFYQRLYESALKYEADIAMAGYKDIDEQNKTLKTAIRFLKEKAYNNFNKKMKFIEKHMYLWNKIFKKDFLDKCQLYFPENVTYEDVIWLPQIFYKAEKVCTVPNTYYHYRENPNSIVHTTKNDSKKLKDSKNAFFIKDNFIRKNKINWELPFRSRIKIYFLGIPLLKIKENEKSWQLYFFKIPLLKFKKIYYHHYD